MEWEISYTDNSHLFGIPIKIVEGLDAYMDIPIICEDEQREFGMVREWVKKTNFLEKAGIERHFIYKEVK